MPTKSLQSYEKEMTNANILDLFSEIQRGATIFGVYRLQFSAKYTMTQLG